MGQFSQAAQLAAHPIVESLLHSRPIHDGHACAARIWADCAGCGHRWYFCSASPAQVRAILAQAWSCPPCEVDGEW